MEKVTATIYNSPNVSDMSEEDIGKLLELTNNICYNEEQLNELITTKDCPNIDESVLDIDINSVIENKLYASIEEQKDNIDDEYGTIRILIDDNAIIEYLYFYLKTSKFITLFDKKYSIVKLEVSCTGMNFAYLQDRTTIKY